MVAKSGMNIFEHHCANGLRALLIPASTAPVVCVSVWYRAGSRHDMPGRSGTAHFLEHMMFKGTAANPKGTYDDLLHELGASNNASTWLDRTNYYILIGNDRYQQALSLEADRMRGALLRERDLVDERPVVLNELDRNEDDPGCTLIDRIIATHFTDHPYQRPVIGLRSDVESISQSDLTDFYNRYYQPDNAFLVIAGQFETDRMIADIEAAFGAVPANTNQPLPPPSNKEPVQEQERRFEIRKAGQQELLGIAYPSPQRGAPDAFAMDVLAQVLGHGRTSRLYQGLVEKGLAVHASAENQAMPCDPFIFLFDIELAAGVSQPQVEAAMEQEISRICNEPISQRELDRAMKRARVEFIMRRDSVSALAFLIGEFEISTGWRYLETYLEQLSKVTPDDVSAAAKRWLVPSQRTVGFFQPTENGGE
jgi:zinc protease